MTAKNTQHPAPLINPTATATLALLCLILLTACNNQGRVVTTTYGTLPDGTNAQLYTLTNNNGLTAQLTDLGATLVALKTPDRDGNLADITVGYDTLDGWVNDRSYMGATVGRYGNRIANAQFNLDEKTYTLAANNGPHHLHGGAVGFNKKLWSAQTFETDNAAGARFIYVSPDGEEGYPGKLTCVVTYTLDDNDNLRIDFEAMTDAPTVVNLVHHTYWNLTGDPSNSILDHRLRLLADGFTPTDPTGIPNNGIQPVDGTPFDFTNATPIGQRINGDHPQLINGKGYDHSWAVNGKPGKLRTAAVVTEPTTGRVMTIQTDQPAIQFYTGNYMDGTSIGKDGTPHDHRTGFCLETQLFPDSPNQPELSSALLMPGQTYTHTMEHTFTTQ